MKQHISDQGKFQFILNLVKFWMKIFLEIITVTNYTIIFALEILQKLETNYFVYYEMIDNYTQISTFCENGFNKVSMSF